MGFLPSGNNNPNLSARVVGFVNSLNDGDPARDSIGDNMRAGGKLNRDTRPGGGNLLASILVFNPSIPRSATAAIGSAASCPRMAPIPAPAPPPNLYPRIPPPNAPPARVTILFVSVGCLSDSIAAPCNFLIPCKEPGSIFCELSMKGYVFSRILEARSSAPSAIPGE